MNETLKNIEERYSCRDFADTPVTEEQIKILVNAALQAPSAKNRQPWHISVVTDRALIDELDAEALRVFKEEDDPMYRGFVEANGKITYNAPLLFVISTDGIHWSDIDCGICCQNIVLAAESLGLQSCIIGLIRVPLGGEKGDEFKKRLNFPDGYKLSISVVVGTGNSGKVPHDMTPSKVTYIA